MSDEVDDFRQTLAEVPGRPLDGGQSIPGLPSDPEEAAAQLRSIQEATRKRDPEGCDESLVAGWAFALIGADEDHYGPWVD